MMRSVLALFLLATCSTGPLAAQALPRDPVAAARAELLKKGHLAADLDGLVLTDAYTDRRTGILHAWMRQSVGGLEVYGTEVALHMRPDGSIVTMHDRLVRGAGARPPKGGVVLSPEQALERVMAMEGLRPVALVRKGADEQEHRYIFDRTGISTEDPEVRLFLMEQGGGLFAAWNVTLYLPDGSHWWNVRLDAATGEELDRNDWVSQCRFDEPNGAHALHGPHGHGEAPAPAVANDMNVYAVPLESPAHGTRSMVNAPWAAAANASPFGWNDTDGAPGAEYTITRGNNVYASEDRDNNNSPGFSPNGGATLDFDFPLNLSQEPINYESAAITNLFYWNNIIHDVMYQYGFDEVSGNFQANNYGNGGAGNDAVNADAQDGSGTNNANFGTPPDGGAPRMQMFRWTYTTPARDSDLDNGVIVHEYGHGISNRLVGGPSNTSCLGNSEQMGEGWSDYYGLMLTMKPGDLPGTARGIGTYVIGQPTTGGGIRPAPYSTNFGVNAYTYASTNSGVSVPHGIGFVWCTMLWEMTWDLIAQYGFSSDLYNGTAGNNIALNLVTEGLRYTPCNPGFVDGRNAILQADQVLYGGANQSLIWAAFARRGLGFSASQGSTGSRSDQVEAFDLPFNANVGISSVVNPAPPTVNDCNLGPAVSVVVRNNGLQPQSNFGVSFSLDGAPAVTETFTGTLAPQGSAVFTFSAPLPTLALGAHTMQVSTLLTGDQYAVDDVLTYTFTYAAPTPAPYTENLESTAQVPAGWTLQNPDNSTTWSNVSLTNGALCATSRAWRIDYYSYNAAGQQDRLISPLLDLAGSAGTRLRFHHAYAQYSSAYVDSLLVQVSADCGLTWTTVFAQSAGALATATTTTSAYTPSACAQWRLNDLDLSAFDGQRLQVRFVGICGYGNNLYLDNIELTRNGVPVALRMMLDGPYDAVSGLMNDGLRAAGLVPGTEPYTALGFTQAAGGGGEVAQPGVLGRTGSNAIVDWVHVELRDAATPTTVVATRPALLQRDGDVVAENGTSPIAFLAVPGNYHVVVRHRNHLGAMTADPVTLSSAPTTVDMASSGQPAFGTDARKSTGSVRLLWAGNVLRDAQLKYAGGSNDRDPILVRIGGTVPTTTVTGYWPEDVTMDGVVKYAGSANDRDPILVNLGGTVPTAFRVEQLP